MILFMAESKLQMKTPLMGDLSESKVMKNNRTLNQLANEWLPSLVITK